MFVRQVKRLKTTRYTVHLKKLCNNNQKFVYETLDDWNLF